MTDEEIKSATEYFAGLKPVRWTRVVEADTVPKSYYRGNRRLPLAYRFAFEFRHDSWFTDAIYDILRKKNVALCWAESERITAPRVETADFSYYRLRCPEYAKDQLAALAQDIATQGKNREVFAFFKHEEEPESAVNAVTVARLCGIQEKPFVLPEKKTVRKAPKAT